MVDGECKAISGCSSLDFPFFESLEKCKEACGCPRKLPSPSRSTPIMKPLSLRPMRALSLPPPPSDDKCCLEDPCQCTSCPSFPDAVCVPDYCDCTFDYVLEGTVVTDPCKDDCQFPSDDCPELIPLPSPCFYTKAPQDINGCIFGCQVAVCPFDNVKLCPFIPFPDCEDEKCVPVNCFVDPCSVASCPAVPGATCISNYCGGCNAIFVDPATSEVTPPSLPSPHALDCQNTSHELCSISHLELHTRRL